MLALTEGWLTFSGGRVSATTTQDQLPHKALTPLATKCWRAAKGHCINHIEIQEQGAWDAERGSWRLTIIELHCASLIST